MKKHLKVLRLALILLLCLAALAGCKTAGGQSESPAPPAADSTNMAQGKWPAAYVRDMPQPSFGKIVHAGYGGEETSKWCYVIFEDINEEDAHAYLDVLREFCADGLEEENLEGELTEESKFLGYRDGAYYIVAFVPDLLGKPNMIINVRYDD